jgi:single-strand DNA-binding protein
MNIIIFTGFIGNIEYKKVNDEFTVCEFSLADNKKVKDVDVTNWFNFKAYNKQADFVEKWFNKGDGIMVEGHLDVDNWEDKDGNKRSKVYIVVSRAFFPPAKKDNASQRDKNEVKTDTQPAPDDKFKRPDEVPGSNDQDDLPFIWLLLPYIGLGLLC